MTAQSSYLNLAPRPLAVAAARYVENSRSMRETLERLALVARVQGAGLRDQGQG